MSYAYNPLSLVNTYGAFGGVSKEQPGDPKRRPLQEAPYHLRLDWLMWFLQFAVTVDEDGTVLARRELWFARLMQKLLARTGRP